MVSRRENDPPAIPLSIARASEDAEKTGFPKSTFFNGPHHSFWAEAQTQQIGSSPPNRGMGLKSKEHDKTGTEKKVSG
jgi:hypothetical protein